MGSSIILASTYHLWLLGDDQVKAGGPQVQQTGPADLTDDGLPSPIH